MRPAPQAAAQRHMDWQMGIFADPIYLGSWPISVAAAVGSNLPTYSAAQLAALKGSCDYFALNSYTSV